MPARTLPILAGVALLALLATTGLVVQWQRAGAAEDRADELAERVEGLEDEVERLRTAIAAHEARAEEQGAPPSEDGEGLLDGLLGGDGPLGDLLAGEVPGAGCLTPAGGGLLGGLLDEGEPLPDDPEALVEVVAEQVAQLRGLDWEEPVEVDFVDDAELSQRLEVLLDEDAEPDTLEAEQRLLAALGAVPDDLDLEAVQRELLDEQVAGYYVPETGELVVRVPDGGTIRPLDRVTLAHELEHALADQALGLPDLLTDPDLADADARLGAMALVEGGATLLMQHWAVEQLSLAEQLTGTLGGDLDAAQASLAAVPHHLQRELLFPYTAGLDYVCELYLDGGWAAVDARYDDPPATSVEVLFPERDGQRPQAPAELLAPEDGASLLTTTFGAAPLLWLLEAPGGDPGRGLEDARQRVGAWAGGEVEVWDLDDGRTAVGITLVDGGADDTLCDALADWHAAAFDDRPAGDAGMRVFRERPAALRCEGADVRYASAPELPTALRIVAGDTS